ncbi:hypothetical protein [Arcobacter sp.]|uniref:hypothetical protein n=1 Tax=unclassified Arcobacter TaxID=2593671 RepID=UPI003AFF8A2E
MTSHLLEIAAVFISQLLLIFLRLVNVRLVVKGQVLKSMVYTLLIQFAWLISSAIGIKALLDNDLITVCFYLAGGVAGSYLNFKIKV